MNIRWLNACLLAAIAALMVACGGGGNDSGGTPPQSQIITFANPGPISGAVGTTINNTASGGGGTGAITYSSGTVATATVNATTGVVSVIAVGSTIITATKAASAGFNQATTTYSITATPGTQTITFAQAGPLSVLLSSVTNNAATVVGGTGALTYASSNTNAVTVDSTGAATAVGVGAAIVTATKAADANYTQATATYTLNSQTADKVSAFIGASGADVIMPASANGKQFVRARVTDCTAISTVATCTGAESNPVSGLSINDTRATLATPAYYAILNGSTLGTPIDVRVDRFSSRLGHAAVYFKNRYWVIGGGVPTFPGTPTLQYTAKADVWSSADGKVWKQETSDGGFGARWFHQAIVFNNRIWIVSGVATPAQTPNPWYSDVWSSADGVTWTREAADAQLPWWSNTINLFVFNGELLAVSGGRVYSTTTGAFTIKSGTVPVPALTGTWKGRASASLTMYNNKFWYIGGMVANQLNTSPVGANAMNDVWQSVDGVSWTQVTANASFAPRFRHSAFVANGKLWVMGGQGATDGVATAITSDAWSTTDGSTWTQENVPAIARSYFAQTVQEPTKATLIAGIQIGVANNVWQTTDGTNWSELSAHAQFSPRLGQQGIEFNGQMWLVGSYGMNGRVSDFNSNEIWRSSDGINWSRVVTSGPIFSPRDAHGVVAFNNRLWVIGGESNPTGVSGASVKLNDVWSSADGATWRQETAAAGFTPRYVGPGAAVVFNGKLWVIGGCTSATTCANDVWSSTDGINWVNATPSAAFSARGPGIVVFNNALWMITSETAAGVAIDEIWRSTDGINWTQQTAGTHFAPRTRAGTFQVLNGRLYVVGGVSSGDYTTGIRYNDVWSSADGLTWRQDTPNAGFSPRSLHSLINHNNELWLIGGFDADVNNDVWRSVDGVNWRVGFSHDIAP